MKKIYQDYLVSKQILVAPDNGTASKKEMVETLVALLKRYQISIVNGAELACKEVLGYLYTQYCWEANEASFYLDFPKSVRELDGTQVLIDQLVHYFTTYGCGEFDKAGHSIFENELLSRVKDAAAKEQAEAEAEAENEDDYVYCRYDDKFFSDLKFFNIVTETQATKMIAQAYADLCASTREWNREEQDFALEWVKDHMDDLSVLSHMMGKQNIINMLLALDVDTEKDVLQYKTILSLHDTSKLIQTICSERGRFNRRYRLSSYTKKLITKFIRMHCKSVQDELDEIIQKRQFWKGLLHQLHFKPRTADEQKLVDTVFDDTIRSEMSMVEKFMGANSPVAAFLLMQQTYGLSFALRHLNYCLSRTTSPEQVDAIFEAIGDNDKVSPIVLLQLYQKLMDKASTKKSARTFTFTRNRVMVQHQESERELRHRKSVLSEAVCSRALHKLNDMLLQHYQGKTTYGKVYINPGMKKVALPLENTTSGFGLGVLPTGSRVKIPYDTVRLFTYWELVNDIDMSCYSLTATGEQVACHNWWSQREWNFGESPIVFSGDQTSGYHGGSEFFDVNIPQYKKEFPTARYIVCSNNVYSGVTFDKVYCVAGYMDRHDVDNGKKYDPKTVTTQFGITSPSTYAILFMIDLETNEMIWVNMAPASGSRVVCYNELKFALKYADTAERLNMDTLYTWLAKEVVSTPDEADLIVSDDVHDERDGKDIIHSRDFERVMKDINL